MMNRWPLIFAVALVVVLAAASCYFLFFKGAPTTSTTTTSNPFGESSNPGLYGTSTAPTTNNAAVTLKDGSTVSVPDPTKIPQPAGYTPAQGYQVAGTDTGEFQILYFPAKSGGTEEFLISILTEPIGSTRLAAEQALQQKLGLSNSQMCQLSDVEVYVSPDANAQYAGQNVGLSFCPGSVKLP